MRESPSQADIKAYLKLILELNICLKTTLQIKIA